MNTSLSLLSAASFITVNSQTTVRPSPLEDIMFNFMDHGSLEFLAEWQRT